VDGTNDDIVKSRVYEVQFKNTDNNMTSRASMKGRYLHKPEQGAGAGAVDVNKKVMRGLYCYEKKINPFYDFIVSNVTSSHRE
jgi:hypothetical protein